MDYLNNLDLKMLFKNHLDRILLYSGLLAFVVLGIWYSLNYRRLTENSFPNRGDYVVLEMGKQSRISDNKSLDTEVTEFKLYGNGLLVYRVEEPGKYQSRNFELMSDKLSRAEAKKLVKNFIGTNFKAVKQPTKLTQGVRPSYINLKLQGGSFSATFADDLRGDLAKAESFLRQYTTPQASALKPAKIRMYATRIESLPKTVKTSDWSGSQPINNLPAEGKEITDQKLIDDIILQTKGEFVSYRHQGGADWQVIVKYLY